MYEREPVPPLARIRELAGMSRWMQRRAKMGRPSPVNDFNG
jgi:hypothetical protein